MADEQTALAELEEDVRRIDGVLGAVVFNDVAANPVEIQVFTRVGTLEQGVRRRISDVLTRHGKASSAERVFVFELASAGLGSPPNIGAPNVEGVSPSWTQEEQAAPAERKARTARRPQLGRISLATAENHSQASVSLIFNGKEAEGLGRAQRTPYALRLTAAATLEAAQALVGRKGVFSLEGVGLVEVLKQSMVLVIVRTTIGGGRVLLGASLVGESQAHEATVRATLDAVNRQLELRLSG